MQSFPKLEVLNVSSNSLVSIPACIQESSYLTSLDLSYCLNLHEIPELPSSVRKVDARHCSSLSANTSSMLWSQVRKEINKLQVVMPTANKEIPQWWDHHGNFQDSTQYPTFEARGKFPVVALAFVFEKMNYQSVELHLSIDSRDVQFAHQPWNNFTVAEDHVLMCDLRVLFSDEEWKTLDACVGHDDEWKTVEVKCVPNIIPVQWGVYVYKEETSMKDIDLWSVDEERSSRYNPVHSRKKRLSSSQELAIIASFSESLQTVVENLKRLMAPREEDQCLSLMQQDRDEEDEGEEGESDMEA
ncbi:hypothetical protein PIB30_079312 [Stylosanthes scabra]|uniref:Disease resistance protein RPS4B/Roq1-like leucine-rich repeats domain-containing protein n=1 Tax=Stylosanthes scabra TaxID=79078 RepID=A0ABU6ZPM8_9FABA|nr:hypothetical protein [Stylosanthes scabra]